MATTRFGTPTWIAARPTPGASYMVSSMSSASVRISSVIAATGSDTRRRRGIGQDDEGRMAMARRR